VQGASVFETNQTSLDRIIMSSKERLLGQMHSNLLRDRGISEEHELVP
jgi:hypothetical protein